MGVFFFERSGDYRDLPYPLRRQRQRGIRDRARKLAAMITTATDSEGHCNLLVITGGGPGIMEAANRGAMDVGGKSIGLNIVLPVEQRPHAYVTPELCFQFHYFAITKMHFLKRARAFIACPVGFGNPEEIF